MMEVFQWVLIVFLLLHDHDSRYIKNKKQIEKERELNASVNSKDY